jgi:hypothetical protein
MSYCVDFYDAFNHELEAEFGPYANLDEALACIRDRIRSAIIAMDEEDTHRVIEVGPEGPVTRPRRGFDAEARLAAWTHFGQRPTVIAIGAPDPWVVVDVDALAAEVCAAIAAERSSTGGA